MEQIATVQAANQPTLRQMLGMNGQAAAQGDAFAMIFQQLMGDGDEDALAAMLMQMTGQLQDDAEDMGAKLAAEMLYAMPGLQPETLLAMLQDPSIAVQALGDAQQALPVEQLPQALAQLAQTLQAQNAQAAEEQPDEAQNGAFFTVLQTAEEKTQPQPLQHKAAGVDMDAVRAAKELMARDRRTTDVETLDIESLQADVDAGRFLRTEAMARQSAPAQEVPTGEEMAQQIKTGILQNAQSGKNEFVVRLQPEGIGEIVVKLSEDKDKISLSILTTSTQTARLIDNEVAALQNALRPLQAEVSEIAVVQNTEQAAQYSAQNQMTDQGRQFFGGQSSHRQGSSHAQPQQDDSFEQAVPSVAPQDGLDTYV